MLTPQHALALHDEIVVDNFAGGVEIRCDAGTRMSAALVFQSLRKHEWNLL